MENKVGKNEVRQRRSQDVEVDGRGRTGLYVVNGVKGKADYTYECKQEDQ